MVARTKPAASEPMRVGAIVARVDEPGLLGALARFTELQRERAGLIQEKRALLARARSLERRRGQVWGIATITKEHKGTLGKVELREETAIVDQYVFLRRALDREERPVQERLEVGTDNLRDERVWSRVIRHERTFVKRIVGPQERFVRGFLAPQQRNLAAIRADLAQSGRRPFARRWVHRLTMWPTWAVFAGAVRLQQLLFLNLVQGQKSVADTAVDLPITVQGNFQVSREELSSSEGRRRLRLAMFNERFLTPERRKVLVFIASVLLVAIYLLSEAVIRIVHPALVPAKRQVDIVFFYAIATRLFLPTPFEFILLTAGPVIGYPTAVFMAALGGVVGSWLLFLLGAQATEGLRKLGKKRAWLARTLDWCQRQGPKHGYWILFVAMAIPFSVDSVAALASVFRLRVGPFMALIFVATLVRCLLFLQFYPH